MLIELILVIIALIWLFFASYFDIKTREIPDWLSYSLLIIAIVLTCLSFLNSSNSPLKYILVILALLVVSSIIYFYEKEEHPTKGYLFLSISIALYFLIALKIDLNNSLTTSMLGLIIFFFLGIIMYYTKQWGGGDTKLLTSLGLIFATYPGFLLSYFTPNLNLPFLLIIFINILIFGALYGIVWTFVLAIKNWKKFSISLKESLHRKETKLLEMTMFLLTILLLLFAFVLVQDLQLKIIIMFIAIAPLFFIYIIILTKSVEKISFIKTIPVTRLTESY